LEPFLSYNQLNSAEP